MSSLSLVMQRQRTARFLGRSSQRAELRRHGIQLVTVQPDRLLCRPQRSFRNLLRQFLRTELFKVALEFAEPGRQFSQLMGADRRLLAVAGCDLRQFPMPVLQSVQLSVRLTDGLLQLSQFVLAAFRRCLSLFRLLLELGEFGCETEYACSGLTAASAHGATAFQQFTLESHEAGALGLRPSEPDRVAHVVDPQAGAGQLTGRRRSEERRVGEGGSCES